MLGMDAHQAVLALVLHERVAGRERITLSGRQLFLDQQFRLPGNAMDEHAESGHCPRRARARIWHGTDFRAASGSAYCLSSCRLVCSGVHRY